MEYTIERLDAKNNTIVAEWEFALYIVSLSGGLGSAIAAEEAIKRHSRDQVALWFADTLEEDEDLYRFLHDLMRRWGGKLYWYTDGRRPPDVWTQKKIIPNSLIAPCTYELKIKPFREFIKAMFALPTVYIGFKQHEHKRQTKCTKSYAEAIPEAVVEYPLLWSPEETRELTEICSDDMGIEPPRLYAMGYDFNNCSGCCCRSGIEAWTRTAYYFPEKFAERQRWEEEASSQDDSRKGWSFCARKVDGKKQPLPLAQLAQEYRYNPETNKMVRVG
jgi:3'-phosphoadenosine 5'-phosphosulfate sulfotransferase (PAPS reductase)/FAD synthetase